MDEKWEYVTSRKSRSNRSKPLPVKLTLSAAKANLQEEDKKFLNLSAKEQEQLTQNLHQQILLFQEQLQGTKFFALLLDLFSPYLPTIDVNESKDDPESDLKKGKKTTRWKELDVVCYGIGKFGQSKTSRLQLATFALLLNAFSSPQHQKVCKNFYLYDPLLSTMEKEVAKAFGMKIIPHNEEGARAVRENCHTLFLMPHCSSLLYQKVVERNWKEISKISILGNSFSKILPPSRQQEQVQSLSSFNATKKNKKNKTKTNKNGDNKNNNNNDNNNNNAISTALSQGMVLERSLDLCLTSAAIAAFSPDLKQICLHSFNDTSLHLFSSPPSILSSLLPSFASLSLSSGTAAEGGGEDPEMIPASIIA